MNERGSSTIELLIAFAVLVFVTTGAIAVVAGAQNLGIDTETNMSALGRAQAQLARARAIAREDFSSASSTSPATSTDGIITYIERLDVADLDAYTKQATSTVEWSIGARDFSVSLATFLTDPASALGGDTCSQTVTGDWTRPKTLGNIVIPTSAAISGIDVSGGRAYVTLDTKTEDNFYVMDVGDAEAPIILSASTTAYRLIDTHIAGRYAFALADTTAKHVQVFDVSHPDALVLAASVRVPSSGATAVPRSLAYARQKLYVGLEKSGGPEFYILDASDPTHPAVRGSVEIGTTVNDIVVHDDIAYLATAATSTIAQAVKIDVRDPSSGPRIIQSFVPTPSWWSGQSIAVGQDVPAVLLGRIRTIGSVAPFLLALDRDDISVERDAVQDTNASGVTVMISRSAFVFANSKDGFQVWNAKNPADLTLHGSLPLDTIGGVMDCEGNLIYIGVEPNIIQVIGPS